ncbi:MAG: class II aldolase/adducin family protein [Clostridiales Family XIII bacterium]|jgi:ribulose-5-phosphate 4-epimerase/fuculose-1-phosphate aldolase|nr:class II aldolase/adducin family protein [Clostridiales Family XIII bacterium]
MFEKERNEIIKTGIALDRYGLIALAGGNVSARMSDGNILVTPSGMIYESMIPEDIILMDVNGNIIAGDRKPSSDTEGILYIFRERPDVMAVIHTHQPYATAISLIQDEFRADLTTLGNAAGGNVAVAPYSPPGSIAMGEDTVKYIGESFAVILAHHGVMTIGKSIKQALNAAVYLEESAKAYLAAAAVGPTKHLTDAQIRQTVEVYKYVGQDSGAIPKELTERI